MENLFHYYVSSNNAEGTIADKTGSRLANITLTDLKFAFMIFTVNR